MTFHTLRYMLLKRHGGNGTDQQILRYPTPESIYPHFKMPSGMKNSCPIDCSQVHCLYDVCFRNYMENTHFPVIRPISIPIAHGDKHLNLKVRYVIFIYFIK